ncbi:MAG: DUF4836 family protein [Bacteroidaceae bacterium]|nr:DUF4836 family protein [Bacteroidaceae bacterium]
MVKKISYLFFLVISFLLASCSKRDYVNSLPKDSQLVAQIDVVSLFQKAGLENENLSGVLKDVTQHPEKTGIDWNEKVYAYVSNNAMGFVAAVSDADKLAEFLKNDAQSWGVSMEEDGDYTWASTREWLLGYNEEQLFAMNIYGDAKVFRQRAKKFMEQDAADSFVSHSSFQKLVASGSDLSIYADASVLPESVIGKWLSFFPDDVELSSLCTLLSVDFNVGKLEANVDFHSDDSKVQEAIRHLTSSLKVQDGVFTKNIPSDFSLFASFHSTPELVKILRGNRDIGMTLELVAQAVPVHELLNELEDVAFYTSPSSEFMAYGQLNSTAIFTDDSWASRNGIRMLGNHSYAFGSYAFGQDGQYFYLSSHQSRKGVSATVGQNLLLDSWASKIKGTYGFVMVNLPHFSAASGLPTDISSQLETAVLRWTEPVHFELTVSVRNQQDNILKVFLQPWIK